MIIKTKFDMYLSEEDIKEAIVHYILSKNPAIDKITQDNIKLTIKENIFHSVLVRNSLIFQQVLNLPLM